MPRLSALAACAAAVTMAAVAAAQAGSALPIGWSIVSTTGTPSARHEATFVMGDRGMAYLLGGRGRRPVNVFNTSTGTWGAKSYPPEELHHFQAVYVNGKVWIPAAWTGPYPNEVNAGAFYVYDVASDSWGTRTAMPAARRRGSTAVAYRAGKIYVAMGNQGGHGEQATTLGMFDIYDIASDSWSKGPDAPNPRDHCGGGFVGGRLCVAGGRDGGVANFFNKNIAPVNCYNFVSGQWKVEAGIPTPRAGSSYGVTCDGKLMVAGGEGAGLAYSRVDVFNGFGWESPSYLNTARHGSGLAIGNCTCGNIYVASGCGRQGGSPELNTTEVYSPGGSKC
jgi:N-acetylneuraminic acid mutarotase